MQIIIPYLQSGMFSLNEQDLQFIVADIIRGFIKVHLTPKYFFSLK